LAAKTHASIKKFGRGRISHFGDAWVFAANIVRRVRKCYERRDKLRREYYKRGYVCCPDIFFLPKMADFQGQQKV